MASIREDADRAATRSGRLKHLPGEEGTWVFIMGDMTVFAVFFATFLYYRAQQVDLFTRSQHQLVQIFGVINTLLLLTSSLCVVMAMRSVRRNRSDGPLGFPDGRAPWLFGGALLCGLGFSAMKFLEYGEKIGAGITPATNTFFMLYYILTGLHFFHLILGMAVLIFCIRSSRKPVTDQRRFAFVEGGACFWHMVDLLWIVLFPLIYLVK